MAKNVKAKKKIDIDRITELVRSIKEREQVVREIDNEIKAYKEEIKQVMTDNHLEELLADVFTIRYKSVVTSKFDSKKFQCSYKELYDAFCTPSESMRFTIT